MTNERPFYNAEDDLWFDAIVSRRPMWTWTVTWPLIDVESMHRVVVADRDQQAHMGVEFD